MAIYTYRCPRCDSRKEVVQSIRSYCVAPEVPDCECEMLKYERDCAEAGRPSIDVYWTTKMERCLTVPLVSFDTAPSDESTCERPRPILSG
jgi:hypothetical protein